MKLQEKNLIIATATNNFDFFIHNIFCHSKAVLKNGEFVGGEYVSDTADLLQYNQKTVRVSGRDHFKSMGFYAHFLWQVFRYIKQDLEAHYFSYNGKMGAYHTEKIKKAIKSNPFYDDIKDCKKSAESILKYTWDGEHFITLEPHGLLEFNRGIHADILYIDDPFQDPANKLDPTIVKKINNIILTQILDMSHDQVHIGGTPQTTQDFFFDEKALHDFKISILPAIVSEKKKQALWPEFRPWEWLMGKLKNKGRRIFNQEYLCRPAFSEDAYLNEAQLTKVINPKLPNYSIKSWTAEMARRKEAKEDTKQDRYAGFDIGKKRHPSHLSVFEVRGKKSIQIHSKWFDKVDYKDQIAYLDKVIEAMGIDYLWYDNTRGEFELFEETGQLPGEMIPVVFTNKRKNGMAVALDKSIQNETIEFLDEDRQKAQMLVVDSDLQALETPEGHGEAFFSNCLRFAELAEEEDEEEETPEEKKEAKKSKLEREEEELDELEDSLI